jgi:hypothetical protein
MVFGYVRVNRESRPEASSFEREGDAAPGSLTPATTGGARESAPFEFEHVHGDSCSCNLRGE